MTAQPRLTARDVALLDRVTWGANAQSAEQLRQMGADRWLQAQLSPTPSALPAAIEMEIAAMPGGREPLVKAAPRLAAQGRAAKALAHPKQRQEAIALHQKALASFADQAASRSLLRNLYSPDQLLEQMTWFWMNHFSVYRRKRDIAVMVGDYEENAIRPRALGRFRDLLEATLRHPAMLRYLDNDRNAVGQLNENYARELMELHTMGVGSGYTQRDVEELTRILTGVGVSLLADPPKLRAKSRALYLRADLFEFNPDRHDPGEKRLLGWRIPAAGYGEIEQALDLLSRHPATARHVSRRLAQYFVGDDPSPRLVEGMSRVFLEREGDIAAVLRAMFAFDEFEASLGTKFRDPVHYAVAAVRLTLVDSAVRDTRPIRDWLNLMGQDLYGRRTPDGYPLTANAWSAPGQMAVRFDIARRISARTPARAQSYMMEAAGRLRPPARAALAQASSTSEWTALFLSSPDFMRR